MKAIKQQLKSRTNRFAATVLVMAPMLSQLLTELAKQFPLLEPYLGAWYNLTYVAIAVLIVFFRNITSKPLSEK